MRALLLVLVLARCVSTEPPPRLAPSATKEDLEVEAANVPDTAPIEVAPVAGEPVAGEPDEPIVLESPLPDRPCEPVAIAAARAALTAATEHGVRARELVDCKPEAIVCPAARGPRAASATCQLLAHDDGGDWEIEIVPRPATGVPTGLTAWVDETGEVGRVDVEGSTWGVVDGVRIQGRGLYESHTHGGEAARIAGARFEVVNERDAPVTMTVLATRWLTANSCELPREVRARPRPQGIAIEPDLIDGSMSVEIPAGTTQTVDLGHEGQAAYMAWCDRFATAATFELDGKRVEVIAEHRVIRRQPLRDD
ncbi:hypothetical protein [Paraliomyxa miuraensis]|uniref:hypothetical protein n=1 Tax=Paraliomyxa miuraensis TaxID=376150 RepID=UPI00224E18DA|nr:hypothetical protein [Paraliomyxa miuraensis]MCX4243487.1 hypothetical protein [Paraliomyxa miuraensis]